jgi:hypothetical protein
MWIRPSVAVAALAVGLIAGSAATAPAVTPGSTPVDVAWSVRVKGQVSDVAALPAGGVLVGGAMDWPNPVMSVERGSLVRYRRDGTRVWRDVWRPGGLLWSPVTGVSVGADGAVYAAGFIYCQGGAGGNGVALLRRYTPGGRVVARWSSRPRARWCDESTVWQQYPTDVAVTGSGTHQRVLVSGFSYRLGDPFPSRGWVRAFDNQLHQQWAHAVTVPRYRHRPDRADAVTVTGGRHPAVYLAGSVHTTRARFGDEDLVVQRLRADGTTVWTRVIRDHPASIRDHDYATGIVAAPRGPVVSACQDLPATGTGWGTPVLSAAARGWVGQLSARGSLAWHSTWSDGSAALAVARTADRHILAAGGTEVATNARVRLQGYRPGGHQLWTWTAPGTNRVGAALAVHSRDIYLAETLPGSHAHSWLLRLTQF